MSKELKLKAYEELAEDKKLTLYACSYDKETNSLQPLENAIFMFENKKEFEERGGIVAMFMQGKYLEELHFALTDDNEYFCEVCFGFQAEKEELL